MDAVCPGASPPVSLLSAASSSSPSSGLLHIPKELCSKCHLTSGSRSVYVGKPQSVVNRKEATLSCYTSSLSPALPSASEVYAGDFSFLPQTGGNPLKVQAGAEPPEVAWMTFQTQLYMHIHGAPCQQSALDSQGFTFFQALLGQLNAVSGVPGGICLP